MPTFSVLILTAAPPGQASEAGGAYVKVDGREALLRSVELFLNRDNIKQIQLAVLDEMMEETKRRHGGHFGFSGVKVISGGARWSDQIAAAAEHLSEECTHVLVHDAARPAVPFSDIDRLMEEAAKHPALTLAAPVRTTLIEVDEGGNPLALHMPERFMQLQTPQAFTVEKFRQMAATRQHLHASELTIVKGSPLNIRIGGTGDGGFAKSMIAMLPKPKVKGPSNPFEEAQW
jgi:2-C-methyl-D-erythritol 4-phosphate cytidylyltransferase